MWEWSVSISVVERHIQTRRTKGKKKDERRVWKRVTLSKGSRCNKRYIVALRNGKEL